MGSRPVLTENHEDDLDADGAMLKEKPHWPRQAEPPGDALRVGRCGETFAQPSGSSTEKGSQHPDMERNQSDNLVTGREGW